MRVPTYRYFDAKPPIKYKAKEVNAYIASVASVKRNTTRGGPSLAVDKPNKKAAKGDTNQVEKEVISSEEEKYTYLFMMKSRV